MNIKSLLLGSAAALVAVSGARAADAVMAEPEAVEYVRVCDAYGAGYFYIPGTETCLKISGYVRYTIDYNSDEFTYRDVNGDGNYDIGEPTGTGWRKAAKAMLNFTAKSDTELGTLTSYIEMSATSFAGNQGGGVRANNDSNQLGELQNNGGFGLDHAWISLGGLKMGKSDNLYDAGLDGEGANGGGTNLHFMSYTFSGASGFSATLALEEEQYDNNYIPNVVGKVAFTQGWGGIEGWVAYDDDDFLGAGSDAGWGAKVRLTANVGTGGVFKALASYGGNRSNLYSNGGKWTLGASYKQTISPKLALTGVVQYQNDTNVNGNVTVGDNNIIFGGVVDYTIVPNFSTKLAVWHNTNGAAAGITKGFLRFERSF
jgi:Porin subfamily